MIEPVHCVLSDADNSVQRVTDCKPWPLTSTIYRCDSMKTDILNREAIIAIEIPFIIIFSKIA